MKLARTSISSFDGVQLAVHHLGADDGRPLVLLHGLFSSADMNWIKFGHARLLAEAGFRVIMPDLRAHGRSDAPHDPSAYPSDVLARDAAAVVQQLGLEQYDLAGFSLGARTAARCVIAGMRPRRLVLAGMGLEGLAGWDARAAFFIDAIDRFDEVKQGDRAYFAVQFMKTMKVDREAVRLLLVQGVEDTQESELAAITMPAMVLCGADDRDNGSPSALADVLADGRFEEVSGTHMSSVTMPEFGQAILRFLQV